MSSTSSVALSPLAANLIGMGSMVAWALGLPAAQSLIEPVPPLMLTAARMALAAAALVPLWALIEGRGAMAGAAWLRGILIGGSTIGFGAFLLVLGQGMTNAVTVAVISATLPIVGLAIEVAMDGRRLTRALVLGVGLSLIGGLVALGSITGGLALGLGAALCFAAVIAFTLGSRLTVKAFPNLSPLGATAVTISGAALATSAAAVAQAALGGPLPDWGQLGWIDFGALALYALIGMALSQVLWILSVGHLGIGLASLHINAAPFYVMLLLFALGDPWNWAQALGAAIVGAGVLIAQGLPNRSAV